MSTDRGMDKDIVHIHTGILVAIKKKKIIPFTVTWMDLEMIAPSEVSQRKTISYAFTYMWNLKQWYRLTYLQNRDKLQL